MHLTLTARVVNLGRTAQFESVVSAQYAITSLFKLPTSVFPLSFFHGWIVLIPFLGACPHCLLNRFQKAENNAARLGFRIPRTKHITQHLRTLHNLLLFDSVLHI